MFDLHFVSDGLYKNSVLDSLSWAKYLLNTNKEKCRIDEDIPLARKEDKLARETPARTEEGFPQRTTTLANRQVDILLSHDIKYQMLQEVAACQHRDEISYVLADRRASKYFFCVHQKMVVFVT
ncbi:hypothetical protein CEXT_33881 [Caerostris extrusa]|uniref:Uncharacterized protein n=1 Tax=Caerostris extrusa TaxID=172846 RepID=A0AAV4N2R7_CAEEX|nr:hypothetical protein CEXT_33881 [Caerostris extrusa]